MADVVKISLKRHHVIVLSIMPMRTARQILANILRAPLFSLLESTFLQPLSTSNNLSQPHVPPVLYRPTDDQRQQILLSVKKLCDQLAKCLGVVTAPGISRNLVPLQKSPEVPGCLPAQGVTSAVVRHL
jgi:hypothetical protein